MTILEGNDRITFDIYGYDWHTVNKSLLRYMESYPLARVLSYSITDVAPF